MVKWGKLIFGNVDSSDYGIYISGDGVYNAPERAVNFVEVPGRDGAIAIDQGRYSNITVTYPAGVFARDQAEFRDKLSAFRNAILSQKGYKRLTDSYHPEEYRMGLYASGLEVSPVNMGSAGQFSLAFQCKPQRWLIDGDYPIPVNDDDIMINPTLFDSRPLLEMTGYGDIEFNGYTISVRDEPVGPINLISNYSDRLDNSSSMSWSKSLEVNTSQLNSSDTITVSGDSSFQFIVFESDTYSISNFSYTAGTLANMKAERDTETNWLYVEVYGNAFNTISLAYGTSSTHTYTGSVSFTCDGSARAYSFSVTVAYDGDDTITYTMAVSRTQGSSLGEKYYYRMTTSVGAVSSKSILGTVFIDCDIGDAYKYEGGELISLNKYIAFGSDLPSLAPGINTISYDNTVTSLKMTPRWWLI